MLSLLIYYGTGEGQTATVADRIADVLRNRGHDATTVDAADGLGDHAPESFDAVLVGASVHMGTHQSTVSEFVRTEREALASRPTAFFQLSLASAVDDDSARADAAEYVDEFLEKTDWQPDRIGLFGGALRYSKYGFLKRLVMKRIAKGATGDSDTSRDYEYTDWYEVEAFTADFAAFVEGRLDTSAASDRTQE
ncbi:flavodoxin domain protein [Natrialba magadii ATCC 43099]|uniref:Flavodoxin domain protein n=1 Tax=Natrialba magadii (strain ATCC 43099 / DSM 3394 / CCM 3739 / CIP 104546 / IAM 13178 / JCM 8861 / NBRC 102185 / NCIMB 2190 / MS3) TaxID=547559 RepID=D3ST86_NATMM|nr:flavodoxin domain-containing protein [Natrialba magadii]ADD06953.1 flavodoxin domain protein [Natrialba magadii ATCC 43099]ELY28423.1 flavodoxin/nitric oxide synthase [Natrialba magadii ATCC 43099]